MKVLADTNIFIDFWKHPTDELKEFFSEEEVVVCNVVIAELLHGAVSEKNMRTMESLLEPFEMVGIRDDQWYDFGEFLYMLRTNGLTVPFQDALISFIAIKNRITVRTNDKHFKLIQTLFPELSLFK